MAFFVLAGCGSDEDSPQTSGGQSKSPVIEYLKAQDCPSGIVKQYEQQVKNLKAKHSGEEFKQKQNKLLVTVKAIPCK